VASVDRNKKKLPKIKPKSWLEGTQARFQLHLENTESVCFISQSNGIHGQFVQTPVFGVVLFLLFVLGVAGSTSYTPRQTGKAREVFPPLSHSRAFRFLPQAFQSYWTAFFSFRKAL